MLHLMLHYAIKRCISAHTGYNFLWCMLFWEMRIYARFMRFTWRLVLLQCNLCRFAWFSACFLRFHIIKQASIFMETLGLEPKTSRMWTERSDQLSYASVLQSTLYFLIISLTPALVYSFRGIFFSPTEIFSVSIVKTQLIFGELLPFPIEYCEFWVIMFYWNVIFIPVK